MSGRADPLAVMLDCAGHLTERGTEFNANRLMDARADVAALVEAAREVVQADRDGELTDALTNALTNRLAERLAPFGESP